MTPTSDLILRDDGGVYHLGLRPADSTDLVITVGDPDRVAAVSRHFDAVDERRRLREFETHVGRFAGRRLACISTGIGTDNVDIVLNELDALANVDLATGEPRARLRQLTFVRLGTSGTARADVPVDTLLASAAAIGLDGLGPGYGFRADEAAAALRQRYPAWAGHAYGAAADPDLLAWWRGGSAVTTYGRTLTCAGFYGPQLRTLRVAHAGPPLAELAGFAADTQGASPGETSAPRGIHNFEMETAGLYALAAALGHRALSLSAILANRATGHFSAAPAAAVEALIGAFFTRLREAPLTGDSGGATFRP